MVLWLLAAACTAPKDDTAAGDPTDTAADTATAGDTAGDTAPDTGDTTGDTSDTAADTADTAADTGTDTGADTGDTGLSALAVPDFALADLNPASTRYGQSVSPRDYMEKVSGWYFIHAT